MRKILYSLISILCLINISFADEIISDFSEESIPVLNEELRKTLKDTDTGTSAGDILKLDSNAKIPAVDGSQITDVDAATVNGQSLPAVIQGDILYGSAANTLSALAAGTSGYVLKTQGAGANPVWGLLGKATTYTGDGNDNRDIAHGLGRTPVFVIIAQYSGSVNLCFWISGMGSTSKTGDGNTTTNGIQAVDGTNVNIGTDTAVNNNTSSYAMFVI